MDRRGLKFTDHGVPGLLLSIRIYLNGISLTARRKTVNHLVSFDNCHLVAALTFMCRKSWRCKYLIILIGLLYPWSA